MTSRTAQGAEAAREETVAEESKALTERTDPELPVERATRFRRTGLTRLKMDWTEEERVTVVRVHHAVDGKINENFGDAFALLNEIYDIVRQPLLKNGEPVRDQRGQVVWRRTSTGFVENWDRLGRQDRERFIYQLTTRMVLWGQEAETAHTEAMLAKVAWEQSFADGYDRPGEGVKDTIEGRTARGKTLARDDHYLAIILTSYSRKAEKLVSSMELLLQRLKDIHLAN